ncbi:MAG: hypothetical protein ACREOD_03100 [Candidatus Dormibacteria bacterium]
MIWVVALALLASAWVDSGWPLRVLELLIAALLIGGAMAVQQRRKGARR